MIARKKLIKVALPLDAINKASAREKSIHHGHPGTLHLACARKARSVISSPAEAGILRACKRARPDLGLTNVNYDFGELLA